MLAIAGVKVKSSVLMRDLVSHGAFEGVGVDKRHSKYKEWLVKEEGNKQVVEPKRLRPSSAL